MPRRGRARKIDPNRTVRIGVRLSFEEQEQLLKQAALARLSLSEYVRKMSLDGEIRMEQPKGASPDVIVQLRHMGNNLNQIARALNSGGCVPPDLIAVCDEINDYIFDLMCESVGDDY